MFENMLGRLLNGAVWGLGAGLIVTLTREGGAGLRPVVKNLMKAYVVASDRVQELTAEAREGLDDLYAEVKAEQQGPDGAKAEPTAPGRSKAAGAP